MLLTVGSLILFMGQELAGQMINRRENDLETVAESTASAVADPADNLPGGNPNILRVISLLVNSYAQSSGSQVSVLDPNLQVIFSSNPAVLPHVSRDQVEFVSARSGTPRPTIRWDEVSREERVFVAAPMIKDGTTLLGFVQVSAPTAPIEDQITRTWLSLFGVGGIVLLITALASILMARQIARPIQVLTMTSERIAAGRLDEHVRPVGPREIRRLGSSFNRMTNQVQGMLRQQRAFTDNAAHELRTPLTNLRLRLDLLVARHRDGDEWTEHQLQVMGREISYLQRLVGQLLTLSTIVESQRVAEKSLLDPSRLVFEIADEMSLAARKSSVTLNVDAPYHLPLFSANAEQMTMMLRNLLDNAIKYTPAGGKVTLTACAWHSQIEIRVSDTGIGIPMQALPHIFERFYRADLAHSRHSSGAEPDGAGLGLPLVQAIVHANGGTIQVESREHTGSTFTVRFPLHPPHALDAAENG